MEIPLRALIIEDSEDDALLIVHQLERAGYKLTHERVETREAMREALEKQTWDIIISDYKMPHFSGLAALKLYKEKGLDIPFIIVSGTIGEEIAAEAMVSGAHDYVMKNNLSRLVPSIQRELREAESRRERKKADEALLASEKRYRILFEEMDEGFCVIEMLYGPDSKAVDYRFVEINPAFEKHTGLQQALGKTIRQMVPDHDAHWFEIYGKVARTGEAIRFENPAIAMQRHYDVYAFRIGGDESQRVGVLFNDITQRKRVEEALKLSEAKYRSIFENVVEGIFQTTPEGRFLTVNPSLASMYWYNSPEELIETITDIGRQVYVNPDERDEFLRIIQEKGIVTNLELQLRRKDGTTFWASINARTVYDENGKLLYYEGTSEDITPRKQAEIELRENRDKLAVIAEGSAIPQFSIDKDHTVILWNKALEIYSGVKAIDVLGTQDHWKAFYPKKRPCLVDLVIQGVAEDEIARWYGNTYSRSNLIDGAYEAIGYFPLMKEGSWIHFTAATIKNSSGSTVAGIETLEDITGLRATEALLCQSEEKYRSIFENAVEGIFQTTPEGQYISVNPALARMIGYDSPEELIKGVTDLSKQLYVNPENRVMFKEILEEQGIIQGFETQQYKRDGSIIWVLINARAVKDEAGKILFYEGTLEDITPRKLSEEKLRKALAGTIQVVSMTVETRDPYTAGHQRKVSNLARTIAQEMRLSADIVDTIRMAGIIHDIGKISVPAEILSKPGKITDIEFSLIKVHSQSGYDILKDVGLPYPIAEIVLQHHERLNGSGYPQGLKGDQIFLEAKIISVADVVEAISSFRPYRPGFGIDVALQEIEKNKGILYDEKVVEVCVKLFKEKGFIFE